MNRGLVASASVLIDAPIGTVWHALVDPELIKRYMFGTTVVSDWSEGARFAGWVSGRVGRTRTRA